MCYIYIQLRSLCKLVSSYLHTSFQYNKINWEVYVLEEEEVAEKGFSSVSMYIFRMSFFSKLNLSKTQAKKTFKNSNAIQFKFCALNQGARTS